MMVDRKAQAADRVMSEFENALDEADQPQDQAGWGNHDIDPDVPLDLPDLLLWRVMIMPVQLKAVSKGGIAMPDSALDNTAALQFIGKVVRMGPLAGKSEKFRNPSSGPEFLWNVKLGDWVVYGRYAGQKVEFKSVRYLIMNDDEILGLAHAPDGFRIYV